MSKHIMSDEAHHAHSHSHSHSLSSLSHHHSHQDDDDLHPFPLPTSITTSSPSHMSSSSSTPEKEEKSFEQLMMSNLNYLPAFIQPEHHIVDDSDHNNMLHPIIAQNDYFLHNSRQDNRPYNKGGMRDVDESAGATGTEQKVIQSLHVNLFHTALGGLNILPSLSKPSFFTTPDGKVRFVCGTEEQDEDKLRENKLVFGQLTHNNTKMKVDFTYPVSDHVRDLQWIDASHVVFAIGSKLGITRLNFDYSMGELIMFPDFHTDVIREIAISRPQTNLVLSGGFDGKVFVTDISKLYVDIKEQRPKSENSLYPCSQVVGSVRWHPDDEYLASCTTDTGVLHIFDVRTDRKRAATVCDTMKKELFTHDYRDAVTLFLGFGDGEIQVFDVRNSKSYPIFQDPFMRTVGEIRFNRSSKHFAVFGIPEFTLWQYNENEMTLLTHQQLARHPEGFYKTTGDFFTVNNSIGSSSSVAVTDSYGNFSVYGLA